MASQPCRAAIDATYIGAMKRSTGGSSDASMFHSDTVSGLSATWLMPIIETMFGL